VLSDAIRQLVLRHAEARAIERQAVAEGMRTMQMHGLTKALAGETTSTFAGYLQKERFEALRNLRVVLARSIAPTLDAKTSLV
jgi:hypothetical protein